MNRYFFLIYLFISTIAFSQGLHFYKEDLNFHYFSDTMHVEGIYYFYNLANNSIQQHLYYPLPHDSVSGKYRVTGITNMSRQKSVDFKYKKNGIYFPIELNAYETVKYHLSYFQLFPFYQARYILKTSQYWNEPFESAHYILKTSRKVDSFSIWPDTSYVVDDTLMYEWNKQSFYPEQDMIFFLQKP